jgi:WD40 repeat protein
MEKEKEEVKEMKSYEIKSNQISYLLTMKQFSNENIYFQLRKGISFSSTMYSKEFSFEELKKHLSLSEDDYENISKLFKFFDTEFSKNTISLIKDEHSMILSLKTKTDDKKEVECRLALEETKLSNEEILSMLYTDMMELKYNNIKLNKKNENFEKDINKLLEENKKMKKEKVELQKEITSLSEENQKLKTTLDILHERFKDFKYNRKKPAKPENLRLIDYLTNKNVNSGLFVVFTGLTDNMEYLVYNNKNNFNLDVMTLKDKAIIRSLKGHRSKVNVIRYFAKDNKEYLLTCDDDKICLVWDIQNNYNIKYTVKEKYFGNIYDAILTFNILGKECLIVSSGNTNEYTKVYSLSERPQFIKVIFGTAKNNTNYLLQWEKGNKKYLIELCDKKITINNLLDDEIYATLSKDPEGYHYSGFIYNDNYLCVSDARNNFLRIWDLTNKSVDMEISFDASNAYEIIQWSKNIAIVGCKSCFVVIDISEGKMIKKVILDNTNNYLRGVKRIKMIQLGECLIGSDDSNNIRLFSV